MAHAKTQSRKVICYVFFPDQVLKENELVKAHLQVENKPGFCQKPGLYTRD